MRLWPDDHHADLLYSHLHSALSDRPPELLRAADSFFQSRAASVSFEKCLMLFKGGPGRAHDAPVRRSRPRPAVGDRKSVVSGQSVSVRVALGGRRVSKKKNKRN